MVGYCFSRKPADLKDAFMPGCVLRVSGDEFDPQEFLTSSVFNACNVFRKGERRGQTSTWSTSGFTVEVSAASGDDLAQQIKDTIEFLHVNREEIIRLNGTRGLLEIGLDFGINRRNVFVQNNYLPPELIKLAAALEIGIEISIYGEPDREG